jgi:DNA-binding MarR family transcriptional regulator
MTDRSRLEQFLTYRLHRVARSSDRDTAAACLSRCGLNASQARCLVAIGSSDSLSLNDLARRADQDKGQASRAAKALVAEGLVARRTSTGDARGVVLTLTRRGRALHVKTMTVIAARDAETFAVLTTAERRTLGEMLDRVARANAGG